MIPVPDMSETSAKKKRSFRGQSAEQRQAERREKLVAAGLQLFGTQGFHEVTVREICAEAHLTERYFYESFRSGDELFAAVYQHLIAGMQNRIFLALPGDADPMQIVRRGLSAFLSYVREDPRVARILFVDVPRVRFDQTAVIRKTVASFDSMVFELAQRLFPKAVHSGLDLVLVAAGLNGSNIAIVSRWVIGGFRESQETVLENCFAVFAGTAEYMKRLAEERLATRPAASAGAEYPSE